jgi:hypothetical protein
MYNFLEVSGHKSRLEVSVGYLKPSGRRYGFLLGFSPFSLTVNIDKKKKTKAMRKYLTIYEEVVSHTVYDFATNPL